MGRCQGGFCTNKIIELIASENGLSLEEVEKEYNSSNLMLRDIKTTAYFESQVRGEK